MYLLKNDFFFTEVKPLAAEVVVREELIEMSMQNSGEGLFAENSKRTYILKKATCRIVWSVLIHAKRGRRNLALEYDNLNEKNCSLSKILFAPFHLAVLRKIFRDFDREKFFKMTLVQIDAEKVIALNKILASFRLQAQVGDAPNLLTIQVEE